MNDVDILIRKQDLDTIYDIYEEMRLFSAVELVGGSPRKQEKFSHHAPPFFSRDLKLMVGTHWGLITPLAPYTIDYDAIWSRVVDIDFYGHPAKSMAPEDNLHHLCVHMPVLQVRAARAGRHLQPGAAPPDRLGSVRRRGGEGEDREPRVPRAVARATRLADRGGRDGHRARAAEDVGTTSARMRTASAPDVSRLLRGRSTHMSTIEKAYSDLNTTSEPIEKWRRLRANVARNAVPADAPTCSR